MAVAGGVVVGGVVVGGVVTVIVSLPPPLLPPLLLLLLSLGMLITGGGGVGVGVGVGVVSTTVIVNEAVPVLPLESVAVQVTVVGPKAKRLPDAGVQTGVIEPSTRSVAVAVNGTVSSRWACSFK